MKEVSVNDQSSEGEREEVVSWLREFNRAESVGFMQWWDNNELEEAFLVARDESGAVVGGLKASFMLNWLRVDLLSVAPGHRKEGVGTRLVEEAERMAEERGCCWAYVDTMSYQAPRFYEGLGFGEVGRVVDWDSHGHDKVFFTKRLK